MIRALVEEREGLFLVVRRVVTLQDEPAQVSAGGADFGAVEIRLDGNFLAGGEAGGARRLRRCSAGSGGCDGRSELVTRRRRERSVLFRCRRRCARRLWRVLVPLPCVDQQKQRERKHEDQDKAMRFHYCSFEARAPLRRASVSKSWASSRRRAEAGSRRRSFFNCTVMSSAPS